MTNPTPPSNSDASKGGKARASKLSPERRSEIARQAVLTRWMNKGKDVPYVLAKYGAADRPLRIGSIEIPCYVLGDGRRVLAQRGLQGGIGLSESGGSGGARRLAALMDSLENKGIDTKGLAVRINNPIRFIPPHGGQPADGYEAAILPDICAAVIEAARLGKLQKQQEHFAIRCAQLQHGFATVGIIALVDEATGYQDLRARDALARIIEKFVAKELRPWVRTFEPEFYQQIFRLNGWDFDPKGGKPGIVGHWTNNIVYKRLAPGVLAELKKRTPRTEGGRLKNRLFQWLSEDRGHPQLRTHLKAVEMLMKYAPTWDVFMERLDKEFPQWGEPMALQFEEDIASQNPPKPIA
jgi:hypothetical protein